VRSGFPTDFFGVREDPFAGSDFRRALMFRFGAFRAEFDLALVEGSILRMV
jgi:hypothetical protein